MDRLERHAGLAAALFVVLLVAVRVLAVAHYNSVTAFALLDVEGTGAVTTGVVLQAVPVVVANSGVLFGFWAVGPSPRGWGWALFATAMLVLFTVAPWPVAVWNVALGLVLGIFYRLWGRRSSKDRQEPDEPKTTATDLKSQLETATDLKSQLRTAKTDLEGQLAASADLEDRIAAGKRQLWYLAGLLAAVVTLPFVLSPQPWLPPERLVISGDEVTAYVLAVENDQVTVLTAEPRRVRRYATADVTIRELCEYRPGFGPLGWGLRQRRVFGGRSDRDYPVCPS